MDLTTARLTLHPIDEHEGRRVRDRSPLPEDRWAPDYPFDGDLVAIGAYLRATERGGDQRPFGYYRVTRRADGVAIGGIGFLGPPQDGVGEIGYGLVPSARGQGYATEAVVAMVDLAATLGVDEVRADTDVDNVASQRVLMKAGFAVTRADADAVHFEVRTATPDRQDLRGGPRRR